MIMASKQHTITEDSPTARMTPPLRVLCVINSLGGGGAERSLVELLPYFEATGIEPVVTCLRRRQEGVESEVRSRDFELRYLDDGGFLHWTARLRSMLRSERWDLVHTTIFESDIAGRLAALGIGIPVLTSLVNTSYEPVRLSDPNVSRRGLWMARTIDGWTARHLTAHFHAITHAVKDSAVRTLGIRAERVTVVERGRDPVRLGEPSAERRARVRRALGLEADEEVVVTVGRQEYQKGQKHLLEAFARVARARPSARLLLVGRPGNASQDLARVHRRLELGDRVRFLGYRDDVPDVLAGADLFVFPSLYEGQGGALVEAMALGLPVVATDIPSTREVTEEGRNALLVPIESPRPLADAMIRLLEEPERRSAFGGRSREIFHQRFTLETSAARMIELYRSLASAGDSDSSRDR